jgi:hypothetical protein
MVLVEKALTNILPSSGSFFGGAKWFMHSCEVYMRERGYIGCTHDEMERCPCFLDWT